MSKKYIRIKHSASNTLIAEGPLGWGITPFEGNLYIDLCNERWQQIRVSADGWEIIDAADSPVIFTRTPSMLPLPLPDVNHGIKDIREEYKKYFNVKVLKKKIN